MDTHGHYLSEPNFEVFILYLHLNQLTSSWVNVLWNIAKHSSWCYDLKF